MLTILGIDPGQSGGLAIRNEDYSQAYPMPETEKDIFELIYNLKCKWNNVDCYLEQVHSFKGQGVSSTFKFGQGYGFLRACIIALEIPLFDITPQRWQKEYVTSKTKDESKTDHKNKLKAKAQLLYPSLKLTLKTCDAMLIADYGYRKSK